ncbi:hypothetical protein DL771_002971 [Monosporascus sp. 5C6A]|nr:hypothetical protein DL771_002971 [Monosporascus sp. 5C6A]
MLQPRASTATANQLSRDPLAVLAARQAEHQSTLCSARSEPLPQQSRMDRVISVEFEERSLAAVSVDSRYRERAEPLVLLRLLATSALAECKKNKGNRTRTRRPLKQSSTVLLQSTDEVALGSSVPAPFDPPQADEKVQTTEIVVTPTTSAAVESPAVETHKAETIPAEDPVAKTPVIESPSAVTPLPASETQHGPPPPAKT